MTFAPYRATRDPGFHPGQSRRIETLRHIGVLSYDCPLCPKLPGEVLCRDPESRFGLNDRLRDLVAHYLCHRAEQMSRGDTTSCPCCNEPLRPCYGADDDPSPKFPRSHPAGSLKPMVSLQLEIDHFLRGSLGLPAEWVDWQTTLAPLRAWVGERFAVGELGRIRHAIPRLPSKKP